MTGFKTSGSSGQVRWLMAAMLGGTALSATLATPALAQQTAMANDDNVIIITAQRRAEALEDIPMTVNYLSADTLAKSGVTSVRDLSNVTSGLQIGQGGAMPQAAIRGVTTVINGAYESNVAVYVDGLYQAVPAAINIDLPSISNVQVLKGPQGTLYGRNATGGAILLETVSPTKEWEGKAELTYATFDDKRAGAYVSGPISDQVGISLMGYMRRTDGYFKKMSRTEPGEAAERTFGTEQNAFRAKLAFDFSDSVRATLGYFYTQVVDPRGMHFSPLENATSSYLLPGGSVNGGLTLPTKLGETAYDFSPTVDLRQHDLLFKLEIDTSIGKIQSITGYQRSLTDSRFDFDGSYLPASYSIANNFSDKLFQQTLDYNIDAIDGVNLVVGAQYFGMETEYEKGNPVYAGYVFQGITNYPYDGTEIPFDSYIMTDENWFSRTKDSFAIYADATFNITDRLSLNVGARYTVEDQHVWVTKYGRGGSEGGIVLLSPETGADKRSSYEKLTPRVSLRYEVTPHTSVYASYSTGFKSGEWNSAVPSNNPGLWFDVEPESIKAYEVGVKSSGKRFRFDLAGFYYDYTDLQISTITYVQGMGTVVALQNAPTAKIYGAEGNFDFKVTDNFNIRAGGTWLHARYGDNFIFTGVSVIPGSSGVSVNDDPMKTMLNVNATQDLSGMQMSRSPDFAGYIGADYLVPIREGGIRFAANAKYTASYVVTNPSIWGGDRLYNPENPNAVVDNNQNLAGTPWADRSEKQRFRQGSYILVNGSVTFTGPNDDYYVRIWGNNLTDHRYRLHYTGTGTFGTYVPMAEPRTYGVSVGYKFN